MAELPPHVRELLAAVLMITLGIVAVAAGIGYRIGTLTHMGAGYVPVVLGCLLVGVGVLMGAAARMSTPPGTTAISKFALHAGVGGPALRGWICILAGVAAFIVLGAHTGLVPASFATVFLAALGDQANTVRDALLLAAAVTAAGAAVFSWGLSLPFPLFAWT